MRNVGRKREKVIKVFRLLKATDPSDQETNMRRLAEYRKVRSYYNRAKRVKKRQRRVKINEEIKRAYRVNKCSSKYKYRILSLHLKFCRSRQTKGIPRIKDLDEHCLSPRKALLKTEFTAKARRNLFQIKFTLEPTTPYNFCCNVK